MGRGRESGRGKLGTKGERHHEQTGERRSGIDEREEPESHVEAAVTVKLLVCVGKVELKLRVTGELAGRGQLVHGREEIVMVPAIVNQLCACVREKRKMISTKEDRKLGGGFGGKVRRGPISPSNSSFTP